MSSKVILKEHFEIVNSIKPFFTSFRLNIDENEDYFLVYSNEKINLFSIKSGQILYSFPENDNQLDEDEIINFASAKQHVVIAFKSGLLRLYKWSIDNLSDQINVNLIKTWKSQHKGPITLIEFDPNSSTLIATGSSDGTVIIWDLIGQYITHFLKGCQGVITTISFEKQLSTDENELQPQYLICASGNHDNKLHVWDLKSSSTNKLIAKFEKHSSDITGTEFFRNEYNDNKLMLLSVSRDKIACVYDLTTLTTIRTIPLYNSISSMLILPKECNLISKPKETKSSSKNKSSKIKNKEIENNEDEDYYFITVGENSNLDVWSIKTGRKMLNKQISDNLTQINYLNKTNQLCIITFENNILVYDLDFNSIKLTKQLCGNNEEVLDFCYLGDEQNYLVVATNSNNLKIFNLLSFNCLIVESHQNTCLQLKSFKTKPNLFASCSKDKTFKLWKFDEQKWCVNCLYSGLGHNGTISALGLPNLNSNWIITGSEDNTLKIWLLPIDKENDNEEEIVIKKLTSQTTVKAHEKGVNFIDVSPNDRLIVTCSNDKLAKLFKFDYSENNFQTCSLEHLGTFSGHRRGIWSVCFSPVDQLIATSSSDLTIKLWSLNDYSCLRTFEGHQFSVLKVCFLTKGMQLLSCCSNGNLKLWNVKNSECINTIDAHSDKINCFLLNSDETQLITGSNDSEINIWKDITEERKEEEQKKEEHVLRKSEVLRNLINERNWRKAIKLSISLNQPFAMLNIFKEIDIEYDDQERNKILDELFNKLREDQLNTILNYVSIWNTNQKHAYISQIVLNCLFKKLIYKYSLNDNNLENQDNLKRTIEKLDPFTRKHYERYCKLFQSVTFFEFLYNNMKITEKN